MKLSKETVKILENLCQVNDTIIFKQGSRQVVSDQFGKILVDVTIPETFPKRFPIFEVKNLLSAISLFNDPDIEFNETSLTIREGSNSILYSFCNEALLKDYKERNGANLPEPMLSFTVDAQTLKKVKTASTIFSSKEFHFRADGETIYLCTGKKESGKTIAIAVGETEKQFDLYVSLENLKLIPDEEYTFYVHSAGAACILSIETKSYCMKYVIICEEESKIKG